MCAGLFEVVLLHLYYRSMRLSEFHRRANDVFGENHADWVLHSHYLSSLGSTAEVAIEAGVDPRVVWKILCEDFKVPQNRRLGNDL